MKKRMTKTIPQVVEIIKRNTKIRDLISFSFLGYFTLLIQKECLQFVDKISVEDMYKYLFRGIHHTENKDGFYITDFYNQTKIIKKTYLLNNIDDVFSNIDNMIFYYTKLYGEDEKNRILNNWNILGLKDIKKEYKTNKDGLNTIIKAIDSIDNFSIPLLIDLQEQCFKSSRHLNDFFTPSDVSDLISKLTTNMILKKMEKEDRNKRLIMVDPTCGGGRLLYFSYTKLKDNGFTDIHTFGCDILDKYSIFTSSIMNLINPNKTQCYIGDFIMMSKLNILPKIDIVLGNPPFGKIYSSSYESYIKVDKYLEKEYKIPLMSVEDKKYDNVMPYTRSEIEDIKKSFILV